MDQGLVNYIWNNVQQGYALQTVCATLLAQGYPADRVDEAARYVASMLENSQGQRRSLHFAMTPKIVLIAGCALLLILISVGAFMFFTATDSSSSSLPRPPSADMQTRPPQTTGVSVSPSPPSSSGNAQQPSQSVTQPPPTTDRPNTQQLSPNSNPNNNANNPEVESLFAIDTQVNQLAAQYPEDAALLCLRIQTQSGKDACYSTIALRSKQHSYCASVVNSNARDGCYIQFAVEGIGDRQICDNIQQTHLASSCRSLYSLSQNLAAQQHYLDQTTSSQYT